MTEIGRTAKGVTIPLRHLLRICPNCGERGPHLVPPSMGDPRFYICTADPERVEQEHADLKRKFSIPATEKTEGIGA